MPEQSELDPVDLRTVMEVLEEAKAADPGPAIPWAVLDGLQRLIPCPTISFNEFDFARERFPALQAVDSGRRMFEVDSEPPGSLWWTDFPDIHRRWGRAPEPARWSGFPDRAEMWRQPLYEEYWSDWSDSLYLDLPARLGGERKLVLFRADGELFSARDQAVLALLRPHLVEIDRRAQRGRDGAPQLTPREWEVLELAAQGLGNQQIARRLFTSTSTVRKHLEHVFDKTGERSRSGAVARMMPLRG